MGFCHNLRALTQNNKKVEKKNYTLFDTMKVLDSFLVRWDSSVNNIIDFLGPRIFLKILNSLFSGKFGSNFLENRKMNSFGC